MKHLFAATLFAVSLNTTADSYYDCEVREVLQMTPSGTLDPVENTEWYGYGETFVVNKITGEMIGARQNYNACGSPVVVDSGSSAQQFKVITIGDKCEFTYLNVLLIDEHSSGDDKPFIFSSFLGVTTGVCRNK